MQVNFCPHCGEDLRAITVAPAAEPDPRREVVKREVTSQEIERLWGLAPLPFDVKPFGVVVDAQDSPVALACSDGDGRHWALAAGEQRMLGEASQDGQLVNAAPQHACRNDSQKDRDDRGRARYGS